MASNKKSRAKNPQLGPPDDDDFQSVGIDSFRSFLCNSDEDRESLSNSLFLWDSVPRYSVSRQAMDKMRKAGNFPNLLTIPFHYRGKEMLATIQPAWIKNDDNSIVGYYPSANEELVEDALRKIAAEQRNAFFDKPNYRSGVVFSLYMLREELKRRGHTRSYQEIVLSLNILARSAIEIRTRDENDGEMFSVSGYFSGLAAVSRQQLDEDPDAKWIAQFHPLVTQEIDTLAYRQFNYGLMMKLSTQLARWLYKQLSLKFTFASLANSFEIRYSTIKRDSGLLNGYTEQRHAVVALDDAFEELRRLNVLSLVRKNEIRGGRNKLEDVIYVLTPSISFVAETKAANKRGSLALEKTSNIENKR